MRLPLQVRHVGYNQICKSPVASAAANKQLYVYGGRIENGSGGSVAGGILKRLNVTDAVLFSQISAAATPDAVSAQQILGTATNIFTTNDNDGYLVQANTQFDLIGFNVSSGSAAGTFTYQYWNGASWATLTTIAVPATYATGTQIVVFQAPIDWVAGTDATVGGADGKFSILVRATTHPTNAVVANDLWVGKFLCYSKVIVDGGFLELPNFELFPLILEGNEAILPYFSAANANNSVVIYYVVQE